MPPRRGPTDARASCDCARAVNPAAPVRLIVVSTEGVDRPDGGDALRRCCGERCVLKALEWTLPPHADNVAVATYLHTQRANPAIEFCAVRPTDLIDGAATAYAAHGQLRNGIFNAGTARRSNVGAFIADLATDAATWATWRGAYPHVLDRAP